MHGRRSAAGRMLDVTSTKPHPLRSLTLSNFAKLTAAALGAADMLSDPATVAPSSLRASRTDPCQAQGRNHSFSRRVVSPPVTTQASHTHALLFVCFTQCLHLRDHQRGSSIRRRDRRRQCSVPCETTCAIGPPPRLHGTVPPRTLHHWGKRSRTCHAWHALSRVSIGQRRRVRGGGTNLRPFL